MSSNLIVIFSYLGKSLYEVVFIFIGKAEGVVDAHTFVCIDLNIDDS